VTLTQEKILIVDDDIDTLRLIGLMLQRQGYQIVAANHGNQALRIAINEAPDLILLDIMMPDLDGFEVTRRLREDSRTGHIPIILFTAKSQQEDRETGLKAGADGYLTKPIQPNLLFEHIRGTLDTQKVTETTAAIQSGQVTGILAPKGGLGISTLAVNLGISLQRQTQQEVIVAEFRPGEGSMALDLGLPVGVGLKKLLEMEPSSLLEDEVESTLVGHSTGIRLLLSSYHPHEAGYRLLADEWSAIARCLPALAKFVLLDLGPGIYPTTEKVLDRCDQVILALDPSPHCVTRAKVMMEDLASRGFVGDRLHIVLINRTRMDGLLSLDQVRERLNHPIEVAIPPVPELAFQAANQNIPLVSQEPDIHLGKMFTRLAKAIMKEVLQAA
jgi:CheY-like chemotaxis protein